jgi:hypothetical protein
MVLEVVLRNVPDFKEFMTVKELDQSSRELADEFDSVELIKIGSSKEGRPILCLKIGEGDRNALLFGFPHPNEPIGSLTVEYLSRFLAENPEATEKLGYTWYFVKAIDPDGATLNEGWFKGGFDPVKYAKNFYRPPGHEQIEWTFPIEYKKLSFNSPPPETRALMRLIDETRPSFMFSLHNAGFCGVYYYVSHEVQAMFTGFTDLVKRVQLPLHRGEPEAPFIKKLHPAIFQMFGIQQSYDFYEENGVDDPQELIKNGTSSDDYLRQATGNRGFTLVCEMPYFYDKALGDDSLTGHDRRELVLESLEYRREAHEYTKLKFDSIRGYCDPVSRIFTSVADSLDNFEKRMEPKIHHAKNSPMYEGKATAAQAFDSMVAWRYYNAFQAAMTARLCAEAAIAHPDASGELDRIKDELDGWVEQTVVDALNGTSFQVIPIKKLVKVQAGSALIAMQHLSG